MSKIALLSLLAIAMAVQPGYYTEWFTMPIDHMNRDAGTFEIRALVQTNVYHNSTTAPMLVYTGNEGPIEAFFNATGFMTTTLQEELQAKVVFIEHRYYGESIPAATSTPYQYLNTQQVLFDFAKIVEALKPYPEAPVIAFGGSYGGMLSAMFRLKYPNVVDGAISSSAPLLMRWVDPEAMFNLTSNVIESISSDCAEGIKETFKYIQALREREDLYEDLSLSFGACETLKNPEDVDNLMGWLFDGYASAVQYNYPYESTYFGPNTPANPAAVSCQPLIDYAGQGNKELWALFNATFWGAKVVNGYQECYDYSAGANDPDAWEYQTCTELPMPYQTNGIEDIFYYNPFSWTKWNDYCMGKYGVEPRRNWEAINYGTFEDIAHQLRYATNIFFTNGDVDPWSVGGIKVHVNSECPVYTLEGAAHHLDLRAPNPKDPKSITDVRQDEMTSIKYWIAQKKAMTGHA